QLVPKSDVQIQLNSEKGKSTFHVPLDRAVRQSKRARKSEALDQVDFATTPGRMEIYEKTLQKIGIESQKVSKRKETGSIDDSTPARPTSPPLTDRISRSNSPRGLGQL